MDKNFVAISIIVTGKVQGVAYRHYTMLRAESLGLRGTVENRTDRSVIISAYGLLPSLKLLIDWCLRGSPDSDVKELVIQRLQVNGDVPHSFSILR